MQKTKYLSILLSLILTVNGADKIEDGRWHPETFTVGFDAKGFPFPTSPSNPAPSAQPVSLAPSQIAPAPSSNAVQKEINSVIVSNPEVKTSLVPTPTDTSQSKAPEVTSGSQVDVKIIETSALAPSSVYSENSPSLAPTSQTPESASLAPNPKLFSSLIQVSGTSEAASATSNIEISSNLGQVSQSSVVISTAVNPETTSTTNEKVAPTVSSLQSAEPTSISLAPSASGESINLKAQSNTQGSIELKSQATLASVDQPSSPLTFSTPAESSIQPSQAPLSSSAEVKQEEGASKTMTSLSSEPSPLSSAVIVERSLDLIPNATPASNSNSGETKASPTSAPSQVNTATSKSLLDQPTMSSSPSSPLESKAINPTSSPQSEKQSKSSQATSTTSVSSLSDRNSLSTSESSNYVIPSSSQPSSSATIISAATPGETASSQSNKAYSEAINQVASFINANASPSPVPIVQPKLQPDSNRMAIPIPKDNQSKPDPKLMDKANFD